MSSRYTEKTLSRWPTIIKLGGSRSGKCALERKPGVCVDLEEGQKPQESSHGELPGETRRAAFQRERSLETEDPCRSLFSDGAHGGPTWSLNILYQQKRAQLGRRGTEEHEMKESCLPLKTTQAGNRRKIGLSGRHVLPFTKKEGRLGGERWARTQEP